MISLNSLQHFNVSTLFFHQNSEKHAFLWFDYILPITSYLITIAKASLRDTFTANKNEKCFIISHHDLRLKVHFYLSCLHKIYFPVTFA